MLQSGWSLLKRAPLLALFSISAIAQQTVDVRIEGYKFEPAEIVINAGDTVRWTNYEKRTSHSVLFPAGGGLESDRLFPDESHQRRFETPGNYPYRCGPHPEMKGLIVVTE